MINNSGISLENVTTANKKPIFASDLSNEQRFEDEKFIRRCIQLARQGKAGARPNPMVGAVVVCDGKIIGEGYHICQGGPHAEVNAISSVKKVELLPESTIYCSLEPCSHYGKTPPCADLIISKKIKRCVVGCQDPFAKVDGQGIKKMLDAGIEVVVGVLEKDCLALNQTFITYHTLKRPFITLKWAQSQNGMMDANRRTRTSQNIDNSISESEFTLATELKPIKFSTALTTTLMHRQRALHDAILVGGGTALQDNPTLTVREWKARGETGNLSLSMKERGWNAKGNPLRVVIDTKGNLPENLNIFNNEAETLVWTDWNLDALMKELYEKNIQSLLVEGGAETLRRFLDAGLWDKIRVETAPFIIPEGIEAPALEGLYPKEVYSIDGNTIAYYFR